MIHEQDLGQANVDWIDRTEALAELGITTSPGAKGDASGHPFHGNRYTGGIGGAPSIPRAEQEAAIRAYQDTRYAIINAQLRGDTKPPVTTGSASVLWDENEKYIAAMDAAMKPLAEDRTLYRCIGSSGIKALFPEASFTNMLNATALDPAKLPIGDVITDKGFISTSATADDVVESRETMIVLAEISAPVGTLAIDVQGTWGSGNPHPEEREIILAHGQSFRVDGVEEMGPGPEATIYKVRLSIVPPSVAAKSAALSGPSGSRYVWEAGDFTVARSPRGQENANHDEQKGGPGSGNFEHGGRPGSVGGSDKIGGFISGRLYTGGVGVAEGTKTRERVPISQITIHHSAHEGSNRDIDAGRGSVTKGPVKLFHNIETGQLLVEDGSHRIAEAVRAGKTSITAVVLHARYSDIVASVRPEDREEIKGDVSDEERDDHGRWTAGGGGAITTPPAAEWFSPNAYEKPVANGWWLDNNAVNSGPRGGNIRVFNLRHESRPDNVFVFERASEARQFAKDHPGGTEHKEAHDVSDEERDDHGRWAAGGGGERSWADFPFDPRVGEAPGPHDTAPERTAEGDFVFYHGSSPDGAESIVKSKTLHADDIGAVGVATTRAGAATYASMKDRQGGTIVRVVIGKDILGGLRAGHEIGGSGHDQFLLRGDNFDHTLKVPVMAAEIVRHRGEDLKAIAMLNLLKAAARAREVEAITIVRVAAFAAKAAEVKAARAPGQKGEGEGHTFRGNRWTGGIGGGGRQTTTPRLKKGDKVGPYKGRAKLEPVAEKPKLTFEGLNESQKTAVNYIKDNIGEATRFGWRFGDSAEVKAGPSYALNPETRAGVLGAIAGLESAGMDHDQLIRSLALARGITGAAVSDYTLTKWDRALGFLKATAADPNADHNPDNHGMSKPAEHWVAMSREINDKIEEAKFAREAAESQGAHILTGKFPAFAEKELGAVRTLVGRDGSLFPNRLPGLGTIRQQQGSTPTDEDYAKEVERLAAFREAQDRVWSEHSAALQAVGRAVYAEIDKSGIGKEVEEAAARVARAAERNTAAYQALSAARTAFYERPENKNLRGDSLKARDDAREEYYRQNANMRSVGTSYGLGQATKEDYDAAVMKSNIAYANFTALSAAMDAIWNGDESDPAVMRAKNEYEAAQKDSTDAYAAQRLSQLAYGIEAVRVLGQIREMGGRTKLDISKSTSSNATKSFQKSAFYYPKEWFDRAFGKTKMQIGVSNTRAFCRGSLVKTGSGNDEESDSTAVHEMGHFLENYGGRSIEAAESEFFDQRIGDDKSEPLKVAWAREYNTKPSSYKGGGQNDSNAPVYVDKFASYYMGKSYGRGPTANYELLTMGMENLRNPSKDYPKTDVEYKAWILGMLATL